MQVSIRQPFLRTISCYLLKISPIRYSSHEFLKKMEDIILRKDTILHPRVRKVKDKLLFSDYLESKKLKFGYKVNRRLEIQVEKNIYKEKKNFLVNNREPSIALKYMTNENVNSTLSENEETNCDIEQEDKPIYMPYAAVDKYELTEEIHNNKENVQNTDEKNNEESSPSTETNEFPDINEKFKKLYEKYLNKSTFSIHQPNANDKHDRTVVRLKKALFEPRLEDNLSNVSSNWMTDYENYDDTLVEFCTTKYGTPDPDSNVSSIPCGGCGALLHCKDEAIPGYLPSELFSTQSNIDLRQITCQRCHFMKNYNTALDVKISPDEFIKLLQPLKHKNIAILLMIDLMDFPCSVWPEISSIIGKFTSVFVVANKVDLLPPDSPRFLMHIEKCIEKSLHELGINNIKHIAFTSAKTGYGIEDLITKLHKIWSSKGDVYLVGCTNVGKSSLFNALLRSDYCRSFATDLVQRATISPWPGTTLNLLKFPISRLNPMKIVERSRRLKSEQMMHHEEQKIRRLKFKDTRNIEFATLQGRIGETYKDARKMRLAMKSNKIVIEETKGTRKKFGIDDQHPLYKNSRWCYDTPGTIQPDQILHLLTTDELLLTMPKRIISPRTFLIKSGTTLFLAGLGRLDCIDVPSYIRCTVFASESLPVNICNLQDADEIYTELLHSDAFTVPINDPIRLKMWPELEPKDLQVTGIGHEESSADVVLSSAGWIAITGEENELVKLRAWTPEARGIYVRCPALLTNTVNLRGARMKHYPAYKRGKQVHV